MSRSTGPGNAHFSVLPEQPSPFEHPHLQPVPAFWPFRDMVQNCALSARQNRLCLRLAKFTRCKRLKSGKNFRPVRVSPVPAEKWGLNGAAGEDRSEEHTSE